ncbi:MAG: hypothetical protein SGI74_04940 [Oligoflexia bacterium]|nr:hypothetical protein [Oligoflexia bacterium]
MFKRSFGLLAMLLVSINLTANTDLDNEINSLELSLRPANGSARTKASKRMSTRKKIPSAKTNAPVPTEYSNVTLTRPNSDAELSDFSEKQSPTSQSGPTAEMAEISGRSYGDGFGKREKKSNGFIFRITGFGGASFTTFDGNDRGKVIPSSVDNPFSAGPTGSILADINIGSRKFVIETGVQFTQVGSYTGYTPAHQTNTQFSSPYGNGTYDESLLLTYIGLPINAKYFLTSATSSSFYAKAGMLLNFLQKIEYNNYGATFLQENRYGGFNNFDAVFSGMLGYSLRMFNSFHLVIEAGGFQGVMPISSNFAVYNAGFVSGLGISYLL